MSVYFKVGQYNLPADRERVISVLREVGLVHRPDNCSEWDVDGTVVGVNLNNSLEGYIQVVARREGFSSTLSRGEVSPESKEYDILRELASRLNPSSIVTGYLTPVFSDLLKAERTVGRS